MAKWNPSQPPELIAKEIDPRHFKQLLAEVTELLYQYFTGPSQPVHRDKSLISPTAPKVSNHDLNVKNRRSGKDA